MPAPLAAIPLGLTPAGFRILQGIMSAARNAPRSAPKDIPSMLKPKTPTNPLNTTVRDPATGQQVSTMGYSPAQIAGSRAGVATGAGAAGAATYSALPTLDSFLPRRAEGDPAGAINRSNAPTDYGMPDAEYREADRPNLFEETNIGAPRFTPEPASDPGREDYNSLFQSLMAAPQRGGPTSTGSTPPASNAAPAERSSRDMFEEYNKSMMDDGGGRADLFFRADKQRMKEEGLASGGAANGFSGKASNGRDAALQKALEIIHHMMVNQR